jgi:hypothetical protein
MDIHILPTSKLPHSWGPTPKVTMAVLAFSLKLNIVRATILKVLLTLNPKGGTVTLILKARMKARTLKANLGAQRVVNMEAPNHPRFMITRKPKLRMVAPRLKPDMIVLTPMANSKAPNLAMGIKSL